METFQRSAAFAKVLCYIESCAESIKGTGYSDRLSPVPITPAVKYIMEVYFPSLRAIVERIPLANMETQRFGNVSKKIFHAQMEEELFSHMRQLVDLFPICWKHDPLLGIQETTTTPTATTTTETPFSVYALTCPHGCCLPNVTAVQEGKTHEKKNTNNQHEEEEKEQKHTDGRETVEENSRAKSAEKLEDETKEEGMEEAPANKGEETSEQEQEAQAVETRKSELARELGAYLKDAFGDPIRLDYGSGHELHFFIFLLICLESHHDAGGLIDPSQGLFHLLKLNTIVPRPPPPVPAALHEEVRRRRQEFIFFVFREYISLIRFIQEHYRLEPAGSHGVWGLDDYHHLPYVFGAAQLMHFDGRVVGRSVAMERGLCCRRLPFVSSVDSTTPFTSEANPEEESVQDTSSFSPPPPPATSSFVVDTSPSTLSPSVGDAPMSHPPRRFLTTDVCNENKVEEFKEDYFYPNMIHWIYTHKHGPFHEHSNMLYNISSVKTWEKTFKGMMKMYLAEVLAKFNVTQHFLFGVHIPWNTTAFDAPTPKRTTSWIE